MFGNIADAFRTAPGLWNNPAQPRHPLHMCHEEWVEASVREWKANVQSFIEN